MLFFPKILRCDSYAVKECGGFYSYAYYSDQIHHDCQSRCVYCDIRLEENGNEGFSLDHFRPQEKFPHLKNVPHNLVLSCAKCNRNKSAHWPIAVELADTHDGVVGFIDPFSCNRLEFFEVRSDGEFVAQQGPSEYLINLLGLNRPSRVCVRRNRLLQLRIDDLISLAEKIIVEVIDMGLDAAGAPQKLHLAKMVISNVRELRQETLKN